MRNRGRIPWGQKRFLGGEVGERVREWVIGIRVPPKPHEWLRHPCVKNESQSDDSEKIRLKEENVLWAAWWNLHITWLKSDIFDRVTQHTRIGNFCTNKKTFAEIYTRNTEKRNGKKITEQAILRLVLPWETVPVNIIQTRQVRVKVETFAVPLAAGYFLWI